MLTSGSLFASILGLNWILFLWETFLDWRQYCVHRDTEKRPAAVQEIITEEAFAKARAYKLDKHRFGFFNGIFGQLQTTVIFLYGVLPILWEFSSRYPLPSVVFFMSSVLLETIISMPFQMYDTFVIEQLHGFNKQTIGFYFKDQIKTLGLTFVLGSPVLLGVEWIINNGGPYFFVYVWIFLSIVIFLLLTIYPEFIAPLFDKYIPLPEGNLKTDIEKLAASVQYPLTKLYVVHGSKRSAHSNAYMYGFWKNKRIVLYDTLLSGEELEKVVKECGVDEEECKKVLAEDRGMTSDEVVAVLGHELGHWKFGHTMMNLIIVELNLLFQLAVFSYFYKWDLLYTAFGFKDQPTIVGLILVFQYVMALYNQVISTVMNILTRKLEFQADDFAVKLGFGNQLIGALTKLGKDNLSLPIDDWLYSMCNHSHPPIPERSATIQKAMKELKKEE